MKELEIWADSFHEGVWCCDNICEYLKNSDKTFSFRQEFLDGFIPRYTVLKNNEPVLSLIVYGSYKSWNPLPPTIKELISWGKPDFIAYDNAKNQILFAVEETAATPTGNQAMQRCERQYGSAHLHIPYWYFVSEFGEHVDGGVRRDNIWPSIAAIKLTIANKTPCVVLHYSDEENIESYSSGKGMKLLFTALSKIIGNFIESKPHLYGLETNLATQYKEMMDFILSEWKRVIDFLPNINILNDEKTAGAIARYALKNHTSDDAQVIDKILVWPRISKTRGSERTIILGQKGKELIKFDPLSLLLEKDITLNRCYILSNNAGSGKPTTVEKVSGWIEEQRKLMKKGRKLNPPVSFTMDISDFPLTENGNVHMTTSKNIVYLYDRWSDLKSSILKAYPRLKGKLNRIKDDQPVFLYLSNSVLPGRLFGDPYTGQLTCYSTCFGKFDTQSRAVVAYFPHQSYTQVFDEKGNIARNKGLTLYEELTDYLIFNAGVAVNLKKKEVL